MPTNEQRRQAAKRKLERQLARRAERAKRRRIWGVSITVGVVVAAVGLVYWLVNLGPEDSQASTDNSSEETPANTTDGPCKYAENPSEQSPKDVGMPDDPAGTPKSGTVTMTLTTDMGAIPVALDRSKAPCTVQSLVHLTEAKFYDNTVCHRLTAAEGLKVLQCGDPLGTGTGGPGYTVPDELEAAQALAAGPAGQDGSPSVVYPRGVVAMANGGPNTTGSQFFLVYGDSTLAPNYTVVGTIDAAGLAVVDQIAAGGIGAGGQSPQDGPPATPVTITSAAVAE